MDRNVSYEHSKSTEGRAMQSKCRTPFLTAHYPLISIARTIFSTDPWTLADHLPLVRCVFHPAAGKCIFSLQSSRSC